MTDPSRRRARWVRRSASVGLVLGLVLPGASGPAASDPATSAAPTPGSAAAAPRPVPRLVLLLAVDQLRRDRLDPALPGGLGRLAREGRRFSEAVVDHAGTETCPGHVALASGRHPGRAGIGENRFFDPASGEVVYCVEDPAPDARVLGRADSGRSPRSIRVDALGDWLRSARPESRVYAVSAKDRAAIALGGQAPHVAYWLRRDGRPGFTTSAYYATRLPQWVRDWNGDGEGPGWLAGLPAEWTPDPDDGVPAGRPDDHPAEWSGAPRAGPKPLAEGDADELGERLYHSPYADLATLDFARRLVAEEGIGAGPGPDLLALSLSATDTVGHLWGPESHEARDALLRLDEDLGRFLVELEGRIGRDRLLVALSSDHGVMPLPEWLQETGRSRCPVEGGRVRVTWLGLRLLARLHWEFGSLFSWPAAWLRFAGTHVRVDRALAAERGVEVDEVVAFAEAWMEARPEIEEAWTSREIHEREGELARLYRNSHDEDRGGDLVVQIAPTCLITPGSEGTTHGSPYDWDREVPLVFWGAGIPPGVVAGAARTVDVAPTLAWRLGIAMPTDLDGRVLPLGGEGTGSSGREEVRPPPDGAAPR